MNKQLILETIRSWADNRFTDAAGEREVLELNTPPPSVDIRAAVPVEPNDLGLIGHGQAAVFTSDDKGFLDF